MNLSNMSNPLAGGFTAQDKTSASSNTTKSGPSSNQQIVDPKITADNASYSSNPLGAPIDMNNPLGGPAVVKKKSSVPLVEQKALPTEFKNEYLERLGKSSAFNSEISKFEQ